MRRWVITAIVTVSLVAAIGYWSRPSPVQVSITHAELGPVEDAVANTRAGTVKACQRSRLSLPIGGQIAALNVTEGDQVSAGQLLMSLWNEDRQARLEQAKAMLLSAQREESSACVTSRSDRREASRLAGLAKQNLVSAESADLAVAKAEASEAACQAAGARGHQAEAEVELATALLAQTHLTAPFDGIVAEVTGEIGEYSTPSPPGVATPPAIDLLTLDCHYISAPIDEVDAASIAPGMPARVTLDAFRDQVFPAKVRRIAPYVLEQQKQARTVEVEAELDPLDSDIVLLAGYSADIEVIMERRDKVLRLPTELFVDENYVYVVAEDNTLEKREVTRGLANWRFTQIVAGVTPQDRVLVDVGSKGIEPGIKVVITDAPND